MVNFEQFEVNRVARGQKRNETPDSKPVGRWQNGLRRILDTLGQAALLRVCPGAFLFDLARLYTQAQRLDQLHHPQQGFCFCTWGKPNIAVTGGNLSAHLLVVSEQELSSNRLRAESRRINW